MKDKKNPQTIKQLEDIVFLKADRLKELQEAGGASVYTSNARPYCIVARDPRNEKVLWAVPITSQVDEYKERARIEKTPDKYKFYEINGEERCLNISRMMSICESDIQKKYYRKVDGEEKAVLLSKEDFASLEKTVLKIIIAKEKRAKTMTGLNVEALYARAEKTLKQERKQEQEQKPEEKKGKQAGISPSTAKTPENTPPELSPKEAAALLRSSVMQIEQKPLEDFNSRRSAELEELEKRHEASRVAYREIADNLPKKGKFEIWGFKKRLQEWEKRNDEALEQYTKNRDTVSKHEKDTATGRKDIHEQAIEAAKQEHPEAARVLERDEERKKAERQRYRQLEEKRRQSKSQGRDIGR